MKPKFAVVGLLSFAVIGSAPGSASAIPNGLTHAHQISNVEHVRWVCNPGGAAGGGQTTIAPTASIPCHASAISIGVIAAGAGGNLPGGSGPLSF